MMQNELFGLGSYNDKPCGYHLALEYVYEGFLISQGYYGIRLDGIVIAGAKTWADADVTMYRIERQLQETTG